MGDIYILMLIALGVLALVDLVVGVSNDAVNFLNSAIGSKAIPIKTIMIIASIGIAMGALTSSGLMEVARKGIFVPSEFFFDEIMFIFMAVMITDVILLDVFNSLGMPTSTTVSIVFELLGASVAMALIKILGNNEETVSHLGKYINSGKALEIIMGILLSVVVAFSIGAIVQLVSRLIYSFNYDKKKNYVNAIFGGIAITAITYFIIIKGLKGTEFYSDFKGIIDGNLLLILLGGFILWTVISQLLISLFKVNILKVIIGIGTFSLAMAFAGNDLVNFIGVPIAALGSYDLWLESGLPASEFAMGSLAGKVETPTILLLIAGTVMVVTLWFSKKAKAVIETGINLSRQGDGHEKFQPNTPARFLVRAAVNINKGIVFILPKPTREWMDSKFEKPVINLPKDKTYEMPAFDLVRASVNLVVAAILISIGTSLKLPLSTTYVTFMVAMGTSLADRAWGRESAVYRVAGVLNVIGGWFVTAMMAFITAAIVLYFIQLGGIVSVSVLLILVFTLLGRNYVKHKKKEQQEKEKKMIKKEEINSIQGVIDESSAHIAEVVQRVGKLYTNVVDDLALQDLNKLKKTEKHVRKLNNEIDELKGDVFYFIKSLNESSVEASRFYILVLGYLQDIAQAIDYISRISFKHVYNNHKDLKKGQIKDLKNINNELNEMLMDIKEIFENRSFGDITVVLNEKRDLIENVSKLIQKQVDRIRTDETSPKNTTLYFSILLETKDLTSAILNLLQLYEDFYKTSK
ncbi:inorganic phosphate transporter [Aureivirga sp. CE67]|uniref:inorganic phosphate transporter n=1 Tax=Aureivirga sp. CE67 TaxID=1788983 RepID=UPI0018CB216A|nr:inorganic phosphate transporter [Aureivirga sp. CE67]